MSKRSWGRSLVDILRQLGVSIDKKTAHAIADAKAADPDSSTADIVARMSLAPPEVMQEAVVIAKEEGSMDLMVDRFAQARATVKATREASAKLAASAGDIARK